jgi:hypothetical protein
MFIRTLPKLNQNRTIVGVGKKRLPDIMTAIADIKKEGKTIFGALYNTHSRHTVYRAVELSEQEKSQRRKSAFDYIKHFTSSVVPKVERFVEERLLQKFKDNLTDQEKRLVDDVYRLRRHLADKDRDEDKETDNYADDSLGDSPYPSIDSFMNSETFKYHDYSSIGKFNNFTQKKWQEYFPFGAYGDYLNSEYKRTQNHAIMCTEDAFKLAQAFSHITTREERLKQIDFDAILNRKFEFKEALKKQETFSLFFAEMAYSTLKVIQSLKEYEYKYLFTNADVFDSFVTVLTQNLKFSPNNLFLIVPSTRYYIIEQMILKIQLLLGNKVFQNNQPEEELQQQQQQEKEQPEQQTEENGEESEITAKDFYPIDEFNMIVDKIKKFDFEFDNKYIFEFAESIGVKLTHKIYETTYARGGKTSLCFKFFKFKQRCDYTWRPEEMRIADWKGHNSGVLLTGDGNGKSMTLAYLHTWAKESGWFILPVHDAKKYTQEEFPIERHLSGIYLQPELAVHFLKDIKIVNFKLLQKTPVNLNEYGKYNFVGTRDDEPEPNPIIWDDRSQTYTDSWKEWNTTPEEEIIAEDYPDHNLRLTNILAQPKTLLEIVEAGISNDRLANCAVHELVHQLTTSEKIKTMFLVDNYLELFKPSVYDSYKYANFKDYDGKIPPHDIALPRLFMKFDGHMMFQGVKVMAISQKDYCFHKFNRKALGFPKGYSYEPGNLKLNDLRNYVTYLTANQGCTNYTELDIQDMWMQTQGNWKQIRLDMRYWFRESPSLEHYLSRKAIQKIMDDAKKF